ncbi:MAG: UbiX family flavin prenyltransferase [Saprospiraceae bacterium]
MKKIVIGISGSSGAIYAHHLLQKLGALHSQWSDIGIIMSKNAYTNWNLELGTDFKAPTNMKLFQSTDFNAPFASGSAKYEAMIICPCSMGTLARVATGVSNDLMTRAADVILKERRQLILVPRETPLSLIHLRNMVTVSECGGIILPAIPSFYGQPDTIFDLVNTVVDRILDQAGFVLETKRWGETN